MREIKHITPATIADVDIELLRPLLYPLSNSLHGMIYIEGLKGKKAICRSCGARDDRIMIRKHKKDCEWVKYCKAIEYLGKLLEVQR